MHQLVKYSTAIVLLLIACKASGEKNNNNFSEPPPSHQSWNDLVKKNVSPSGKVDYKGFANHKKQLNAYLTALKNAHPHRGWSANERMAYWINAYNAFTVKLILKHYPVESIKDIGGKSQSPWKIDFINIQGKTYTLNDIEHNILREQFNEPRIHFAVNCASVSCPRLLNAAYSPNKLETQLNKQAQYFINQSGKNTINKNQVRISKVFKWYSEDFTQNRSLIDYLNKYADIRISPDAEIEYKDYDWSLNN